MNWGLFIIAAIILLCIRNAIFKKLDKDEQKYLSTPGRADFLRIHYQQVITFIQNKPNYQILFERSDLIRIGVEDETEYYAIGSSCGKILIAYVRFSSVVKEWKFRKNESVEHIIYELSKID